MTIQQEPLHRTKRAIYIVLLVVALFASGIALYNQFATDSQKQSLAQQVSAACEADRAKAESQGLNCDQAAAAKNDITLIPGPEGPRGPQGVPGKNGTDGSDGSDGSDGRNGSDGTDGASGRNGENGRNGSKGDPGEVGEQGQTGPKGDTGSQGPEGPRGPAGPKGDKGDRGADGEPADQITGFSFVGDIQGCELQVSMASGNVFSVPVPVRFCVGR